MLENVEIIVDEEPFVYSCFTDYPDNGCLRPGIDLEYIHTILVDVLKLSVSWHRYDSFHQLYTALSNGTINLIGNTQIIRSASASEKWLQTPPSLYLEIGFFVKTQYSTKLLNPFSSFTYDFWISIIGVTLTILAVNKYVQEYFRNWTIYVKTTRIVCIFWAIIIAFILDFYGNVLTSDSVTYTKSKPMFNDLDELGMKLMANKCRLVLLRKYIDDEDLDVLFRPKHNRSWAINFRTAFLNNRLILVEDKSDLFNSVLKGGSCTVGLDYISQDTSLYKIPCDIELKLFTDELSYRPYVYYHTLTKYKMIFKDLFSTDAFLQYASLLWHLDTWSVPSICRSHNFEDIHRLSMDNLFYAFVLLSCALSANLIVTFAKPIFQKYDMYIKLKKMFWKKGTYVLEEKM